MHDGIFQRTFTGKPALAMVSIHLTLPLVLADATRFGTTTWPRWAVMWLLAVGSFAACKRLSRRGRSDPIGRRIGYNLFWCGMDAAAFFDPRAQPETPTLGEWIFAGAKFALGLALVGYAAEWCDPLVGGAIGIAGLLFVFHFGGCHLQSCYWRAVGVEAQPIMNWPIAARSVADFWEHRWNIAFRDLAHRFLFHPLARRWGTRPALVAGFFCSGLLHETVISIPAGAGYGLPTVYFLLQAAGVFIERSRLGRRLGLASGLAGWLFAAVVVLAPLPLLFHPPFITRVIAPFVQAIGGDVCPLDY